MAKPVIEVKDYDHITDFTNKQVVLIQKGDRPEYKNYDFKDDNWKVISLPSSWNNQYPDWKGICWYRIHITFPRHSPARAIAIKLGTISDVDEVYLNGKLIGKTGEFPPNRKSSYDKKRLYEIPVQLIRSGEDNLLAIRVAALFPYEMGPYTGSFQIAHFEKLLVSFLSREFLDAFLTGIYILVALFFLVLFIKSTVHREFIFFALFSFFSAIYLFLWTQVKYLLIDDFLLLKRIEYMILFILPLLMLEYITNFFNKSKTKIHYIYYGIAGISLVPLLIWNDIEIWNTILLYIVEPCWLIPVLYSIYICITECKNNADSAYILFSFPVMWLLFLNDIMVIRGMYSFYKLSNYGFLLIIIGTSVILRNRYLRLFNEIASLKYKKGNNRVSEDVKIKLEEAISYLKNNFTSDISREGLAGHLDINPDYLGKIFKMYTSETISGYINNLRIKKASEMLKDESENVTEIAFSVGFESLSTFYRVFKKITGLSPLQYREQLSEEIKV